MLRAHQQAAALLSRLDRLFTSYTHTGKQEPFKPSTGKGGSCPVSCAPRLAACRHRT